jgi:tRNA-binding protein
VAGTEKLVRLFVDFRDQQRKILAGMKHKSEDPAEIVGKQILFVVNLKPRKMMGEISEGMLFDIEDVDGITTVLAIHEKFVLNSRRAG